MQAIGEGFPAVYCHAPGDGSDYSTIVWDGGAPLPSQETLDAWIAANPNGTTGIILTKYQFRMLFTLNERIAIDSAPMNTAIPANYRAMLNTMTADLAQSGEVHLAQADVIAGVNFLEQLGLIATGRAAQILANQAPTA